MLNFVMNYISQNNLKNILQIGGNDGQQDDFVIDIIKKYNLEAHILEPIEEYFLELKQNYINNKNVKTYNYAITKKDGEQEINFIKCEDKSPQWLKGCSSFYTNKNVLSGYGNLNLSYKIDEKLMSYIKQNTFKRMVKTLCLKSFLSLANITNIDIVVMDTEGCELEILQQFNFEKIDVKLFILEFHNQPEQEKKEIINIFNNNFYKINFENGWDIIAYR